MKYPILHSYYFTVNNGFEKPHLWYFISANNFTWKPRILNLTPHCISKIDV